MPAIVEYFESAFTTGFQYRFVEVTNGLNWRDWYQGNYHTLLPASSSVDNGMSLINGQPIRYPLFRLTSDFYANAALGDMPTYSSENEALNQWMQENFASLDKVLRRGTHYWSIDDVAVFATQADGSVEAINPLFYFRVGTPDVPDRLVGHILAIRYTEKDANLQLHPEIKLPPNRCRVIKLRDGVATEQTFSYAPDIVGQPLTPEQPSPVTNICVAGGWDPWYGSAREVAAALIITLSVQGVQLNRYANRPLYVPMQIMDALRQELPQPGATMSAAMAAFNNLTRPAIGISGMDDMKVGYGDLQEDFDSRSDYILTLWDSYFLSSGLPPSSFGIGIGRNASGLAREKAQDAASARVEAYRRDLAECLPTIIRGMGAPEGEITFNWSSPPFQTREGRVEEILSLYDRKLITPNEARLALGWQESDEVGEDDTTEQVQEASSDDAGDAGNGNGNGNAAEDE